MKTIIKMMEMEETKITETIGILTIEGKDICKRTNCVEIKKIPTVYKRDGNCLGLHIR